jgi:hypothetical protein
MKKLTESEINEQVEKAMQKFTKKHDKARAQYARCQDKGAIKTIDDYREYKRRLHPEYYLEQNYCNVMRVYDRVKNMSKTEWFIFKARTSFNHVMNRINLWLEMRGI